MVKKRSPASSVSALALAMLLGSLGVSIATVALPTLARDLAASMAAVQWIILSYLLAVTVTIVIAGRMGDLYGHRRVFLTGLLIYAVGSMACAVAPAIGTLIAARAVQGIGGAVLMALPMSLARETVSEERTGATMGVLGSMSAIGTALGPSLGGALIAWQGWRLSFFVLSLLAAGVLVVGFRTLNAGNFAKGTAPVRLDLAGASVLAIVLTAYALSATGTGIFPWAGGPILLTLAAVGVIAFVVVERRAVAPLVSISTLGERHVSASLVMNLLVSAGMMATLVVGPFYLTFVLELNEVMVGLVMAVGPAIAALSGAPAGKVTDRFGARRILMIGLAQMMLGFCCLALLPEAMGIAGYILALAVLTPGFQLFLAANNTSVMVSAREDQRGMISGLLGLSRNLGFMTGASVMGAVFTAAAGTEDVANAASDLVSRGFAVTFFTAAALMVVAILAANAGHASADRSAT